MTRLRSGQTTKISGVSMAEVIREGIEEAIRSASRSLTRYERSMELLRQAFSIADTATIYDNSFEYPVRIAKKTATNEVIIYPRQYPSKWSAHYIRKAPRDGRDYSYG
ncbi:MAG: hypothetical protein A4E57_02362 [Syntrophorhabdaceae bacterium PtaU1.Bin034]|jgi:hypothetical protein|nr:MAG: hypothetical protein A4E57_02362 [Syntrophorhabdaceae bacterium PtaU1.Bin034]